VKKEERGANELFSYCSAMTNIHHTHSPRFVFGTARRTRNPKTRDDVTFSRGAKKHILSPRGIELDTGCRRRLRLREWMESLTSITVLGKKVCSAGGLNAVLGATPRKRPRRQRRRLKENANFELLVLLGKRLF
jgi:hypothetical protein